MEKRRDFSQFHRYRYQSPKGGGKIADSEFSLSLYNEVEFGWNMLNFDQLW